MSNNAFTASGANAFTKSTNAARGKQQAGVKTVHAICPNGGFGNTLASNGVISYNPALGFTYTKLTVTTSWNVNFDNDYASFNCTPYAQIPSFATSGSVTGTGQYQPFFSMIGEQLGPQSYVTNDLTVAENGLTPGVNPAFQAPNSMNQVNCPTLDAFGDSGNWGSYNGAGGFGWSPPAPNPGVYTINVSGGTVTYNFTGGTAYLITGQNFSGPGGQLNGESFGQVQGNYTIIYEYSQPFYPEVIALMLLASTNLANPGEAYFFLDTVAVQLNWNPVNETGVFVFYYGVFRAPVVNGVVGSYTQLVGYPFNSTQFTDTTAVVGNTYAYYVEGYYQASGSPELYSISPTIQIALAYPSNPVSQALPPVVQSGIVSPGQPITGFVVQAAPIQLNYTTFQNAEAASQEMLLAPIAGGLFVALKNIAYTTAVPRYLVARGIASGAVQQTGATPILRWSKSRGYLYGSSPNYVPKPGAPAQTFQQKFLFSPTGGAQTDITGTYPQQFFVQGRGDLYPWTTTREVPCSIPAYPNAESFYPTDLPGVGVMGWY